MPDVPHGDVLRRERIVLWGTLLGVAAISWIYLWRDAARMDMTVPSNMAGMAAMPANGIWSPETLALTFVMWTIMMVGMMLPSASPAIILYGTLVRKSRENGKVLASAWIFAAGYLAIWAAFSAVATLLQTVLQHGALMTPTMVSNSTLLTGGLLVLTGVYQWLPFKDACLQKCRAPLQFFITRWKPGRGGAFRMGAEHGFFCVGCCWAIMLLLFAAGVMNLIWVAVISAVVLIEKLAPGGRTICRLAGAGLAIGGTATIVSAI